MITAARHIYIAFVFSLIVIFISNCGRQHDISRLKENFKNPPASAKPRTWFHAMSGNMTKAGLTMDLEAIERVGIGGILLFNISQGIPNGPIKYNSEEHHEMLKHAAAECERLNLSFGVHNCDGWSSSGGPWIKPEQSMKMVVWSEVISEGGDVSLQLPQPTKREGFYDEIAVLAYPALPSEIDDFKNRSIITASDETFDVSLVSDNRLDRVSQIKMEGDENPWIQFEYRTEKEIRSVFMVFNDRHGEAVLQVSEDGKIFKTIRDLYKVRTGKGEWAINDHFEPVKSRFFRLRLNQSMTFKEAKLSSTYSLHNVLGRTSIARTEDKDLRPIGNPGAEMIINKNSIVDLTAQMNDDGELVATLPDGSWTILRFGYSSTGAFNHPASDHGRGLECDKFNREAFKIHYDAFAKKVIENTKAIAPNAMQYIEIDSYEMGGQNWTQGYKEVFRKEKGYDLMQFLPLYTGRFVESAKVSEAVLWDLRELNCRLMGENYFGYFAELCEQDGIMSYIEPYGFGPLNDLDVGGKADINMGEFWMNREMNMVQSAVSASHVYGKNIISAESFTSTPGINWKGNPAMAKISGDKAWAHGINEFMFHRFAHQANTHVKPGMTMNRWGFHFDRTQTWWENAGADWFKYMARGQYMLRQGVPVSDLLVFVGDGSPNAVYKRSDLGIPAGTNFDCVNADVLINRVVARDGKLVLPEGTSYQALVLKNSKIMSLSTLKRIHDLSADGIQVVGEKPEKPSGYLLSQKDINLFNRLKDELWSGKSTISFTDWNDIFTKTGIEPDLSIKESDDFEFMHRRTGETDIYFLYNDDSVSKTLECTFGINNRIPELWNPMTGGTIKTGQYKNDGNKTTAWIDLESEESIFVVFRESANGVASVYNTDKLKQGKYTLTNKNGLIIESASDNPAFKIDGSWEVEFLQDHDYQGVHTFDWLSDWKEHMDKNIKYYSGTAVYRKSIDFPKDVKQAHEKYLLDLGEVKIVAEVYLNGKRMGISWMPPYRLDITDALILGDNQLEIKVTNQWSNKLIGDERFPPSYTGYKLEGNFPKGTMMDWYVKNEPLPAGKRTTFCTAPFYKANDPLMPSGLLGPVTIIEKKLRQVSGEEKTNSQ